MNWYEIALGVVLVVVSVLIIVFTLAQEQKGQGLSGAADQGLRHCFLCRHAGRLRPQRTPVILAG